MENKYVKIKTAGTDVALKVMPGHYATNHAHINYYIDMTTMKTRTSEAQELAKDLVSMYLYDTVIDTIVCMEETEVIGAFLSEELTQGGFLSMNAHKTIYVVSPEFNNNSQIIFRENLIPMIRGKHVMILMASVTTGLTVNKAIECIQYYDGILMGVSAIFSAIDEMNGVPIICRIMNIPITGTVRSVKPERNWMLLLIHSATQQSDSRAQLYRDRTRQTEAVSVCLVF